MDDSEININPEDISRLSDREKRELQTFIQGEGQKMQIQKRTARFTLNPLSFAQFPVLATRTLPLHYDCSTILR